MSTANYTVHDFLKNLSQTVDMSPLKELITMLGPEYKVDTFSDGPALETYWDWKKQGIMFLFSDETLHTIFLFSPTNPTQHSYGYWEMLLPGLETYSREAIQTVFGEPIRSKRLFDLYKVDDFFVNAGFGDDGEFQGLTLMVEDILARK